jgi:hypothetical protein
VRAKGFTGDQDIVPCGDSKHDVEGGVFIRSTRRGDASPMRVISVPGSVAGTRVVVCMFGPLNRYPDWTGSGWAWFTVEDPKREDGIVRPYFRSRPEVFSVVLMSAVCSSACIEFRT